MELVNFLNKLGDLNKIRLELETSVKTEGLPLSVKLTLQEALIIFLKIQLELMDASIKSVLDDPEAVKLKVFNGLQ